MLELSYILLTAVMVSLIIFGYSYAIKRSSLSSNEQTRKIRNLILMIGGWFIYLGILSYTKFLHNLTLPPRFIIFLLIPLVIMCVRYYKTKQESPILANIPTEWLLGYQTFRILVETILFFTFIKGIIPHSATFEGYNFDVLWGIMAPIVAYLSTKNINLTFLKVWNIIGALMVIFVAAIIGTSTYLPQLWGSETSLVSLEFFTLPYLLIAGFLAPSAVFIHVVTLTKLKRKK